DPLRDPTRNLPAAATEDPNVRPATISLAAGSVRIRPQPTADPAPSAPEAPERRAVPRGEEVPSPMPVAGDVAPSDQASSRVAELPRQSDEALARNDRKAYALFLQQAAAERGPLDPAIARRLQDHLQLAPPPVRSGEGGQLLNEIVSKEQRLKQQIASDVARQ